MMVLMKENKLQLRVQKDTFEQKQVLQEGKNVAYNGRKEERKVKL
jgi:hypothetical protein